MSVNVSWKPSCNFENLCNYFLQTFWCEQINHWQVGRRLGGAGALFDASSYDFDHLSEFSLQIISCNLLTAVIDSLFITVHDENYPDFLNCLPAIFLYSINNSWHCSTAYIKFHHSSPVVGNALRPVIPSTLAVIQSWVFQEPSLWHIDDFNLIVCPYFPFWCSLWTNSRRFECWILSWSRIPQFRKIDLVKWVN